MKILFFSRGKGRGHAVPDSAIAEQLQQIVPSLEVLFVSYSTGAETLSQLGWKVIDLGLPEDNHLWDLVAKVIPVFLGTPPHLVVSHEEFFVVPIAKTFGHSVVYLTDWFLDPRSINMQALDYADSIVFLDDPGFYDIPETLAHKIFHVGPVLGTLSHVDGNRAQSRAQLGLPPGSKMVLVAAGGALQHSEARAPIADLVLGAYDLLDIENKHLIWVAGDREFDFLEHLIGSRPDILVMKPHAQFLSTLLASDVVITKGNRITVLEAEYFGVPSISVSFGNNPIDDYRIGRVRNNIPLRGRGLGKEVLAQYIAKSLKRSAIPDEKITTPPQAARVAEHICRYLPRAASAKKAE